MKKRIYFIPVFIILLAGIIIGTIYDLQISQAVYLGRNNGFGTFMAAFGEIPGYLVFSFFGGVLIRLVKDKSRNEENFRKCIKIFMYVSGILCFLCGSYFTGQEIFSPNAYDKPGVGWFMLGIAIGVVINAIFTYIGYKVGSRNKNPNLWIAVFIVLVFFTISIVPLTNGLKIIFHRPRYRIVETGYVDYCPWYNRFGEYKNYLTETITSEEFKSFPSGHSCITMMVPFSLVLFKDLFPGFKKYWLVTFIITTLYAFLLCYSRMIMGGHYLSDVCFGAIFTVVCAFIAYEICNHKKFLQE